jgi:hypothetical protein
MWERIKQVVKQAKGLYSWYSFGSGIVKLIILTGVFSGVGVSVIGVVTAIIKGVPWPIIIMAGSAVLLAVGCLAATPLLVRIAVQAMQPVSDPNIADEPIRPHWDAWKHYEKFTVHQAACLLENLEPTTHPKDPKVAARMGALCAAIRTGQLDFIPERAMGFEKASMREGLHKASEAGSKFDNRNTKGDPNGLCKTE